MNNVTKIGANKFWFRDIIPDKEVTVGQPIPVKNTDTQFDSASAEQSRNKMIERNRNAWKQGTNPAQTDTQQTQADTQKDPVTEARNRMVERHRNAWKQGNDNG